MSRMRLHRKNYNEPGHAHELTFARYQRFAFLKSDRTCHWLAEAIDDARRKLRFRLWAYVFMPDHAHVVVCPIEPEYDVAAIRKAIKSPVGIKAIKYLEQNAPDWLPRITRVRGGTTERLFWQSGGGYDRNITDSGTLLTMIDYLHLNPVRKGLVQRAREWQWSSAAWYEGITENAPLSVDSIPVEWLSS
jgi:putative transposase